MVWIRIKECPNCFQFVLIRGVEKKSASSGVLLAIDKLRTIVHKWLLVHWLVAHPIIKHLLSVLLNRCIVNFCIFAIIRQVPISVQCARCYFPMALDLHIVSLILLMF